MWVGRGEASLGNLWGIVQVSIGKGVSFQHLLGPRVTLEATLPQRLTRKNMLTPCLSLGVKTFSSGGRGNAQRG